MRTFPSRNKHIPYLRVYCRRTERAVTEESATATITATITATYSSTEFEARVIPFPMMVINANGDNSLKYGITKDGDFVGAIVPDTTVDKPYNVYAIQSNSASQIYSYQLFDAAPSSASYTLSTHRTQSVSLARNGTRAAVACTVRDSNSRTQCAVFIFDKVGTNWQYGEALTAMSAVDTHRNTTGFVYMNEDGDRLLWDPDSFPVEVWEEAGGTWNRIQTFDMYDATYSDTGITRGTYMSKDGERMYKPEYDRAVSYPASATATRTYSSFPFIEVYKWQPGGYVLDHTISPTASGTAMMWPLAIRDSDNGDVILTTWNTGRTKRVGYIYDSNGNFVNKLEDISGTFSTNNFFNRFDISSDGKYIATGFAYSSSIERGVKVWSRSGTTWESYSSTIISHLAADSGGLYAYTFAQQGALFVGSAGAYQLYCFASSAVGSPAILFTTPISY